MRLDLSTWYEIEDYLKGASVIIIPAGSTEQHGPMGVIGTDTLCAREISERAGEKGGILVSPPLAFTPAPFNLAFPGSISVKPDTFRKVVTEIIEGLAGQGFRQFYFLNGHGANCEPLSEAIEEMQAHPGPLAFRLKSWWDFDAVNTLRKKFYGSWEGMHATPSEIAITQATHRILEPGLAETPPEKLSDDYIRAHAGDKHGGAKEHRAAFPDGRVGSHSALATPEQGAELLTAAVDAVVADCTSWSGAD
jgi:creatinine amidohydrolase